MKKIMVKLNAMPLVVKAAFAYLVCLYTTFLALFPAIVLALTGLILLLLLFIWAVGVIIEYTLGKW